MRIFGLQGLKEHLTALVILAGSVGFMWTVMIYPNTLDWQPSEDQRGTIETLLSNSNIIGPAQITAVVKFEDGRTALVAVPVQSDLRAGTNITVSVLENADNQNQKRYQFKSVN